ncbi:hypothetical protein MBLNU459_g5988t1 [Dothideomycetes sp. NU459]
MTVALVCIFIVRFYVFEGPLVNRVYGEKYHNLSDTNKRTFINHHVAGAIKILLLITASYPVIAVLSHNSLSSPYFGSKTITLGDVLLVISELFCCMYVFELFYRTKISPISALHHVGAILIAQTGIVLSETRDHRSDGTIEFMLCLLWGFFDILAELWPHIAIILYRVWNDDHEFLRKVFLIACCTEVIGTLVETITVMTIFGSLWDRWTLELKIVTPILHVLFSAAQLWGAKVFFSMYKSQVRKCVEQRKARNDDESGVEELVVVVGQEENKTT